MNHPTLEELEQASEEILSKAKKSEKLDPDDIAENAEEAADDADDSSEDADAVDDADDAEGEEDEDAEKSIETESVEDADLASAMAEVMAKSLADVTESVAGSQEFAEKSSVVLAKSILAQNVILNEQKAAYEKTSRKLDKLNKSLEQKLAAIDAKLEELGAQPAHMRKSVASENVIDRNFNGSLEGTGKQQRTLSKAEMVSILNNELANGSQVVTPMDILQLESGGQMRDDIRVLLESKATR